MVFDLLIAVPAAAVAVAWRAWPDLLIFIGPSFAIILDLVVDKSDDDDDPGTYSEERRVRTTPSCLSREKDWVQLR